MKKIILLWGILVISSVILTGCINFGSSEINQDQMFEDYDYMVNVLHNMMPHAIVIRKSYNIDVWKKLAVYRKKIPQIKNTREFAVLVASALYACKGHHLGLKRVSPSMDENYLKSIYGELDTKLSVMRNYDLATYANQVLFYEPPFPQTLYFTYYDGNYYIPCKFKVNDQCYPDQLKLLTVDGYIPEEIEREVIDHLPYYDSNHSRFYNGNFYCFFPPKNNGERIFEFLTRNNDKIKLRIKDNDKIFYFANSKPFRKVPKFVWYISEYQAIYIRIPTMNYVHQHFYLSEIDKIQRKYHPHFAIIDVRYNGGGSDIIALLMINALLSKPNLGVKYAFLASEYQRKELIRRGRKLDKFQEKEIEFLDKQKFLILNNTPIITENNDAPKVHHIYVLSENVYSAAGTLTSRIAYDNDNIISVGFNNPRMLGRGVNPFIFALPNSKLTIQVEPALDVTNCTTAMDCMHTKVELELKLHPIEYFQYLMTPVDTTNVREYLLYNDPFMQKVFRLINRHRSSKNALSCIKNKIMSGKLRTY